MRELTLGEMASVFGGEGCDGRVGSGGPTGGGSSEHGSNGSGRNTGTQTAGNTITSRELALQKKEEEVRKTGQLFGLPPDKIEENVRKAREQLENEYNRLEQQIPRGPLDGRG